MRIPSWPHVPPTIPYRGLSSASPPAGASGAPTHSPPRGWGGGPLAPDAAPRTRDPVYYGRGVPGGDGRPVLLIPGFLAGDQTLLTMPAWLRRMDYKPEVAGISFKRRH